MDDDPISNTQTQREIIFKMKQLIKSRTRKFDREANDPSIRDCKMCPLRPGVSLDAKYNDVYDSDSKTIDDLNIQPVIHVSSPFTSLEAVCNLHISLVIALFGGSFVGNWMHSNLGDIHYAWNGSCGKHLTFATFGTIICLFLAGLFTFSSKFLGGIEESLSYVKTGNMSNSLASLIQDMTEHDVEEVYHLLPWHVKEFNVNSIEWLNELLIQLWPRMKRYIWTFYDNPAVPIVDSEWLEISVSLKHFRLGKRPPIITGARSFEEESKYDECVIDLEATYDSDMEISAEVSVRGCGGHHFSIPLGLRRIFLRARLRLVISHLFEKAPFMGHVNLVLLDRPYVRSEFTGAIKNLHFIHSPLEYLLSMLLMPPHGVKIDIAKLFPSREIQLGYPRYVLQVDVLQIFNLPRPNTLFPSKPDPFVLVEVEGVSHWTHVVRNSRNPEFFSSFSFTVTCVKEFNPILIVVYDEDIDQDVIIGSLSIPFCVTRCGDWNGRLLALPLLHPSTKCVVNEGNTRILLRISSLPITRSPSSFRGSGLVSVLVEAGRGLQTLPILKHKPPELRLLVRVSIGTNVQVTRIRERTGYPIWREVVHFPLPIAGTFEHVKLEVIDVYQLMERRSCKFFGRKMKNTFVDWAELSSSGKVLGSVTIPADEVVSSLGKRVSKEYQLTGLVQHGFLSVTTDYFYCCPNVNIIENWAKPAAFIDLDLSMRSVTPEETLVTFE